MELSFETAYNTMLVLKLFRQMKDMGLGQIVIRNFAKVKSRSRERVTDRHLPPCTLLLCIFEITFSSLRKDSHAPTFSPLSLVF